MPLTTSVCRRVAASASPYAAFHKHAGSMTGHEKFSTAGFQSRTQTSLAAPTSSGHKRTKTIMNPVGVPRVPYRLPRSNYWAWVDIWNCLYRERIVFLSKVRTSILPTCLQHVPVMLRVMPPVLNAVTPCRAYALQI